MMNKVMKVVAEENCHRDTKSTEFHGVKSLCKFNVIHVSYVYFFQPHLSFFLLKVFSKNPASFSSFVHNVCLLLQWGYCPALNSQLSVFPML